MFIVILSSSFSFALPCALLYICLTFLLDPFYYWFAYKKQQHLSTLLLIKGFVLRYSFTSSATGDYPSPFQFQLVTICNQLISVVRYLRTSHLLPQSVTICHGFIFSFYKQISMSMITCCVFQFPSRTISFLLPDHIPSNYLLITFPLPGNPRL